MKIILLELQWNFAYQIYQLGTKRILNYNNQSTVMSTNSYLNLHQVR